MDPKTRPTHKQPAQTLLHDLNAAALALHRSARSEGRVFAALGEQLEALALSGCIGWLDEIGQQMHLRFFAHREGESISKLVGRPLEGLTCLPDQINPGLSQVFRAHRTVYFPDSAVLYRDILKAHIAPANQAGLAVLFADAAIVSPVWEEARMAGMLILSGNLLPEDTGAVETFANHLSVALDNARLLALSLQAEAQYRQLFESASDGILIIEPNSGRILSANPTAAALTGYSQAEILNLPVTALHLPDETETVRNFLHTIRQHGQQGRLELSLRRADGQHREVEYSATVYEAQGQPLIQALLREVTERMQAEQALRRRAEELATLHTTALDIMSAPDLSSLLETITERAVRLLNASSGGLYLCNPDRGEVRCVVSFNTARDYTGVRLKYGEGAAGAVAQSGQPLLIDDYSHWSGQAEVYRGEPFTALLAVPLLRQDQVIGVIDVLDDIRTRVFSSPDLELLNLFASQAAIAIEDARLLEAEREARNQAEILREIGQAVSGSLNLEEILYLILGQLRRMLVFENAAILILGKASQGAAFGEADLVSGTGFTDRSFTASSVRELLKNNPILVQMSSDHQPIVIADVPEQADWVVLPGTEQTRSFLGVPIIGRDQLLGAFWINSNLPGFYRASDARMVQTLASHTAVAIQNARLFEAERAQLLLSQTLQEVGALLTSQLEVNNVLQLILDLLGRVVDYDSASIHLVDEDNQLYLASGRGLPTSEMAQQNIRPLSTFLFEYISNDKALVIPDTRADPGWVIVPGYEAILSWIGAPLLVKGSLIGMLNVNSRAVNAYGLEVGETVMAFANQAATAIENARLFAALEQRATELLAVRQATLSLTASLNLEAVLDVILENTLRFLPGSATAHIYLYRDVEEGRLTFASTLWADGRRERPADAAQFDELALSVAYNVARTGQMTIVPDIQAEAQYDKTPAQSQSDWQGSIIGLPLIIGQRVVGVMDITYPKSRSYSEAELRVLNLLGDQAAIAIENARLFEQAATERRHLGLLYEIGRELATSINSDDIFQKAIVLTCQALGGLFGEAYFYNTTTTHLELRSVFGYEGQSTAEIAQYLTYSLGKGIIGWVAQQNQPVIVHDLTLDARWTPVAGINDRDRARALIAAPVADDNRLLGVLAVFSHHTEAFTVDRLDLLKAICQHVRLALSNAKRYQQVQSLVEKLADEQERLQSVVERLPVGVLLLEEVSRTPQASDGQGGELSSYRLRVTNSQGRKILAVLPSGHLLNQLERLGSLSVTEIIERHADPLPVEITIEEPAHLIIEVQARPLGGNSKQWVLTMRDVTKERENQARIQMQERLATVGQLAAGIAHDFNNIMAAILVYSDLMIADPHLKPGSRERLNIIQQQVQRASTLIRQILDFSRRSVMEQARLDFLPFLKELEKLLRRVLPESIHVELSYQPGIYPVKADPTHLQQVCMNLALNARDAMPEGGTLRFELNRLRLSANQTPPIPDLPQGDWACLSVSDTGHGIPPDILPHIFEPFFTTKPVGQGTGLGLSQVYGIVKQHNGHLDVQSQSGEGTRFNLYLPIVEPSQENKSDADSVLPVDGKGRRILVVEDDIVTRDAIKALLQVNCFEVLAASDGEEGLALLEGPDQIELVVTDIVMPRLGGMALYRIIRERWPGIRILFITGHPLDHSSQAILEKGNVHWLQKPFSGKEFNSALKLLLTD